MPQIKDYPEKDPLSVLDKFLLQDGSSDEVKHALLSTMQAAILAAGGNDAQTWVPTTAGFSIGNGTDEYKFKQIGPLVFFQMYILAGNTTSLSSNMSVSLPVPAVTLGSIRAPFGNFEMEDSTVNNYIGSFLLLDTNTMFPMVHITSTAYEQWSQISNTVPYSTFGDGDTMQGSGFYFADM